MALFSRKKGNGGDGGEPGGNGKPAFEPQPEKARQWFDHARNAVDRSNFGYALTCYGTGLRFDPTTMSAHEAMFNAAVRFAQSGGKPASRGEMKAVDGPSPIDRFAAAEFAWMRDLKNPALAMKFMEAAADAASGGDQLREIYEVARWHARRVLNVLSQAKKPSKGTLLAAKDLFARVGAWDEALQAGQAAYNLDPRDNNLAAELTDLAAQRAMDQGGYEAAAGQEGGYRKFIRDADRQRELQEAEAIAGGETIEQRNLERARAAYEASPADPTAIHTYGQLLKKQDTNEALQQALTVYTRGFEATREYRFRMLAGDIEIERAQRKLNDASSKLTNRPGDGELEAARDAARQQLLALQEREYRERVEKYPTDRRMKMQLGEAMYEQGHLEEAMAQFQAAKEEPKLRLRAGYLLGKCFAAEGWHREAISEYREALEKMDASEREIENHIRYDMMESMLAHAREERSIDLAREARDICSDIARRDIRFRDIIARRKEVDQLIKELTAPGGSST